MENTGNRFVNFHTGRFLRDCLQSSGFSIKWLASHIDMDMATLERLLAEPNIDAELFVTIGRPMGKSFFNPLHDIIFHGDKGDKEGLSV